MRPSATNSTMTRRVLTLRAAAERKRAPIRRL
jgi:hypothetical protein